jgi:hypothetical protein
MQPRQCARVLSIKYGSPFVGTNSENCSGQPLPVVLYGADGALDDASPDDASPQPSTCTSCSPGRCASASGDAIRATGPVARCRLGRVTFCIRGHRCNHEQDADSAAEPQASWTERGYSIRAAQIVEHADDHCLVVPLVLPCQSPAVRPRCSGDAPQHLALWEGGLEGEEVHCSYSRSLACPCTTHA